MLKGVHEYNNFCGAFVAIYVDVSPEKRVLQAVIKNDSKYFFDFIT